MGLFADWQASDAETINAIFSGQKLEEPTVQLTIVGGGLSGLLLALKLSREQSRLQGTILLVDAGTSLGGRLLYSDSRVERIAAEDDGEFFKQRRDSSMQNGVSGPGFESIDPKGLEIMERHLRSTLSDDEIEFLDRYCGEGELGTSEPSKTYFVRREPVPWRAALGGSSDTFTRKEAEFLAELVKRAENEPDTEAEASQRLRFIDSPAWKEASAATKEGVTPTLEALLGRSCLEASERDLFSGLRAFSHLASEEPPALFRRNSGVEFALELILRNRGVRLLTGTRVTRLLQAKGGAFEISLSGRGGRLYPKVTSSRVVLSVPLISCFSFLPRDLFTGTQSKSVLRSPPSSLVTVEYPKAIEHAQVGMEATLLPGSRFIFPTERAMGLVNSAGNLLCYGFLGYEDSLEAASVRESVGRLRRAAARLLKEEALKGLSGQEALASKNAVAERVILLAAARYLQIPVTSMKDTRMGAKGLYYCGDGFTYSHNSWKNIVDSVQDVTNHLMKG
jgi:hypothetical protein